MAEMNQIVTMTGREQAELVEQPIELKPQHDDELVGRTLCSLVSPGTEINAHYLGQSFPCEPGYAAVCELIAMGDAVDDLQVGDRVLVTGPNGIGGHRRYQRCPRIAAVKVPNGLAPEAACHARLMNVTMTTLTTTAARPPQSVMVIGLGPIGHLGAQLFAGCGYRVIGVDPVEARRDLLREKGVSDVFASVAEVGEAGGAAVGPITLAIDTSGHERTIVEACQTVRKRAEVVLTGVPWRARSDASAFDLMHAVYRNFVKLRSGWEWEIARHPEATTAGSVFENIAGALRWLNEDRVNTSGLYEVRSPEDPQAVYQQLLAGSGGTLSVIFDWRS